MKTEPYDFAVETDAMSPRLKIGDALYVNPCLPPQAEAIHVFHSADGQRREIGELVSWDEVAWHIRHYHELAIEIRTKLLTLRRSEWPTCHLVTEVHYK